MNRILRLAPRFAQVSAAENRSAHVLAAARNARSLQRAMATVTAHPFALKARGGFIDGSWRTTGSGAGSVDVVNPATGEVIATLPDMGRAETEAAIAAAKAALPAWAAKTAGERSAVLRRLHDLMAKNLDGLAVLLTQESGKPFEEAKGEIGYSMSFLEWFAEEGKRAYGDVIPSIRADRRMVTIRQPVGVAALLTPWNFSSAMIARKIAPALAAGCSVVVRPSANTPLSALAIVQLAEEAGVPKGVINLVVGHDHDAIAGTLCTSRDVAKLSFTGSTRVGKLLMGQAAGTLKKLSMELGGNAPFIVFADADVDAAVEGAVMSKFRNAGQTCVCANRVFVHSSLYESFRDKLVARVKTLRVGDGLTAGVNVGPVISEPALRRIEGWVSDAAAAGARVLTGGRRLGSADGISDRGFFYAPTVVEDIPPSCALAREEIFGPVAPLERFDDEADVVARANSADVGLAGYFYTRDLSRAWRVAEALEVGMVGVNTGIISSAVAPFGGVKESGFGREGSKYGLDEYSVVKYIMMGV